jgi:hypothetical protein
MVDRWNPKGALDLILQYDSGNEDSVGNSSVASSTDRSPQPGALQQGSTLLLASSSPARSEVVVQHAPVAVRNESDSGNDSGNKSDSNIYEEKRKKIMHHNSEMFKALGLPDDLRSTYGRGKKPDKGAACSASVSSRKRNASHAAPSPYLSPTRSQRNLQNQEILVVLGGELNCNSPVHSKAFNLLLPLSSERANSVVVWKGMEAGLRCPVHYWF